MFGVPPIAGSGALAGEAAPGGFPQTSSTAATHVSHDVGDAERPSARLGVWFGNPLSVSGQPRRIETAAVSERERAGAVEVRKMSFNFCMSAIQKAIDQSNASKNQVNMIINTVILNVTKITMDESTVVIACNKHDQKILIERYAPVSQPLAQ